MKNDELCPKLGGFRKSETKSFLMSESFRSEKNSGRPAPPWLERAGHGNLLYRIGWQQCLTQHQEGNPRGDLSQHNLPIDAERWNHCRLYMGRKLVLSLIPCTDHPSITRLFVFQHQSN